MAAVTRGFQPERRSLISTNLFAFSWDSWFYVRLSYRLWVCDWNRLSSCITLWPEWPHTNCQCQCHNTGRNLFSFYCLYFQLATSFHSDRGNIISPLAEVAPHGWGRWAWRRGQSARRSWLLHSGDRVGSSGCCRAGWRDEIWELSLPTTTSLKAISVCLRMLFIMISNNTQRYEYVTNVVVPRVAISHSRTPNDQTSLWEVKTRSRIDSIAIHLSGRRPLVSLQYWSPVYTTRASPKSHTFTTLL